MKKIILVTGLLLAFAPLSFGEGFYIGWKQGSSNTFEKTVKRNNGLGDLKGTFSTDSSGVAIAYNFQFPIYVEIDYFKGVATLKKEYINYTRAALQASYRFDFGNGLSFNLGGLYTLTNSYELVVGPEISSTSARIFTKNPKAEGNYFAAVIGLMIDEDSHFLTLSYELGLGSPTGKIQDDANLDSITISNINILAATIALKIF